MYFKDWIGEVTDHVFVRSEMSKLRMRFNQNVTCIQLQLSLIRIITALVGHLCKFQARSSYRGDVESTGSCQTGMRSAAAWTLLRLASMPQTKKFVSETTLPEFAESVNMTKNNRHPNTYQKPFLKCPTKFENPRHFDKHCRVARCKSL